MNLEKAILLIQDFKISEKTEDYEITEFFEEIRGKLTDINLLNETQKKELIKSLFNYLKNQEPEMYENFSFIHFIEDIDNPSYKIYNSELIKFNLENGTITSVILLNRYLNSLKGNEWKGSVELMKSISENKNYSAYVREFALDFYESQINRNEINSKVATKGVWSKIKSLWN